MILLHTEKVKCNKNTHRKRVK